MVPRYLFLLSLLSAASGSLADVSQQHAIYHNAVHSYQHDEQALADLGLSKLRRRHLEKRGVKVAFNRAVAFAPPTPDIPTMNVLDLEMVPGSSLSQRYLRQLDDEASIKPDQDGVKQEAIQNVRDSVYLTTMKFGHETFKLVIDTGSADTWLIQSGFKCLSVLTRQAVSAAQCRFSRSYNNTKTFKHVNNQHFNISYADGEFLNGEMGREDVTFGGIVVSGQEFGLINYAAWNGDTVSSGLTGLAFPSVTRAYPGTDPKADKKGGNVPYDPIFTSMWKKKLVAPHFSVALNRAGEKPGVIALGGLPGSEIRHETTWAKAPMQHLAISMTGGSKQTDYQLYVVETQGWDITTASGAKNASIGHTKTKVVLDTGTTLSYLPPQIAQAINKAWDPPASQDPVMRQYMVKCDAKAPKVAMKIGGVNVYFDAKDMMLKAGGGSTCLSGIQAAKSSAIPSILGGVFMKNVVAVFDIGAAEIRFANRIR